MTERLARSQWLGRRYLFKVAGRSIPSYTAMLGLGCCVGLVAGAAAGGASGLNQTRVALAIAALLVPALIGSRLWFVLERWDQFRADPRRISRRSEGGAALNGGLVASVGLSVPLLGLIGLPFWAFWDAASFTMLVGLIFTRAGCLMNGCCAGRVSSGALALFLPDERGEWKRRIPTQLLEAAWGAAVLAVATIARPRRPFEGAIFLGVLATYGCARILLEFARDRAQDRRASYVNIAFSGLLAVAVSIVLIAKWPG
jgi:phosphatidylglycerol:prolipoprotein diacylglycerol transferase